MEPDLIGQEKTGGVVIDIASLDHPQWSLTSSVRKSPKSDGISGERPPPAMEPDLIGQEKHLRRGVRRQHGGRPAMEPDLIGQEKRSTWRTGI